MNDLLAVSTAGLHRLRQELGSLSGGFCRAYAGLADLDDSWPQLAAFDGLDVLMVARIVSVVVAERESRSGPTVSLVWSGPEGKDAWSTPTAAVLGELFAAAKHSVLIAGFSFDNGASIFAPLHARMKAENLKASLFLHIDRANKKSDDIASHVGKQMATFMTRNWPFGAPFPDLYYDPRTAAAGSIASLHAKCVVIDERITLVGSANFTDRGQSRNVEVGARIDDVNFASQLTKQFHAAVTEKVFVRFEWGAK